MTKDELIAKMQEIPGNPVPMLLVDGVWKEIVDVISTGNRNGITFSTASLNVGYLGPVP